MAVAAPAGARGLARVVVRVVVDRDDGVEPGRQIPLVFAIQGQRIVFRVTGDEHLTTILGGRQIDSRLC